jgi:hypothetical protein
MSWKKRNKDELDAILEKIEDSTLACDGDYEEGILDGCRWRWFGPTCDSDARGELHLADSKFFDRWANSVTITVHLGMFFEEHCKDSKKVLKRVFEIYR